MSGRHRVRQARRLPAHHTARGILRFARCGPHAARTTAWAPLVVSCLTGLAVSALSYRYVRQLSSGATILVVRLAFVPVVAGVAAAFSDQQRQFKASLPAPVWLSQAAQLLLAIPVVGLTAAAQLELAASALHGPPGSLPWVSLTGELVAWLGLTLAAEALVARTSWSDLGPAIAIPAGIALVGVLAIPVWHLLPLALSRTSPQRVEWAVAWHGWSLVAVIAAAVAVFASRDPWLRLRWRRAGYAQAVPSATASRPRTPVRRPWQSRRS